MSIRPALDFALHLFLRVILDVGSEIERRKRNIFCFFRAVR